MYIGGTSSPNISDIHCMFTLSPSPPLPVESCSMDTLRNAVKVFTDMEVVSYRNGSVLHIQDSSRLIEIAENIAQFKS